MTKRRRNDGPWRRQCIEARGHYCRACRARHVVQVDHIIPRSAGGPSVVENGLVLCSEWDATGKQCHAEKTAHRLKIRREWLELDQIAWLAEQGWVRWGDDGDVYGRGRDDFEPEPPTPTTVLRSLEPQDEGAPHGR